MQQPLEVITFESMENDSNILRRIREIDEAIARLNSERVALLNIRQSFWQREALRPGDKPNARNARKFELLGKIQQYLKYEAKAGKAGKREASTRELYDYLVKRFNESVKYGTFRSHLSRFKEEGRLQFNEKRGRWSIAPEQEELF